MLKSNKSKYFSFDIFDTCIVRSCGNPDNIFFLLARYVVRTKEESLIRAFVIDRKNAEKKALKQSGKEAVTIMEIYSCFDLEYYTDWDKKKVMDKEIEIERHSFVPVKQVVKTIEDARAKGEVLFISDMYLPHDFLVEQLLNLGIMKGNEELFVSGEVGLTKEKGTLYDFVKSRKNIVGYWRHYGDNFYSDYVVPRKKGIKVKRINTDSSFFEAKWLENAKFSNPLATSVLSGLSRSLRLNNYEKGEGVLVADLMSPLFVTFVISVIRDAQKKGIRHLYFASRDTYAMYLIAKKYASKVEIDVKYLYISTRILYPTYIVSDEMSELKYILNILDCFIPSKVMKMLGYTTEEINLIADHIDIDKEIQAKNTEEVENFVSKILNGELSVKLRKRCEKRRNDLTKYLYQQGFISADGSCVGLIDLGWRCTSQEMLERIVPNVVNYYYLGVTEARVNLKRTGVFNAYTYWHNFPNNKFIEYYMCRTTSGSVVGYEDRGGTVVPICEEVSVNDEEDVELNLRILGQAVSFFQDYPLLEENADELFYNCAYKSVCDFIKYPDRKTIKLLSSKLFVDHYTFSNCPVIIKLWPWSILRLLYLYVTQNNSFKKYRYLWVDGSLIHTFGYLGCFTVFLKNRYVMSIRNKDKMKKLFYSLGLSQNNSIKKAYMYLK